MKNLDTMQQERAEIMQRMSTAVVENNAEAFSQAFGNLADQIQQSVVGEFEEMNAQQDTSILSARGCRVLTSKEHKYYQSVIDAMKSPVPQQALATINTVLPETVVDSVFENLSESHPLLSEIKFTNTGALVKILLSTTGGVAAWGTIDAKVTSELSAGFTEMDLTLAKLTAFIPINKYMIELGPQWIDNYVRQLLTEALAVQLEAGIVAGTGKNQPIGMTKKLTGATDGVYPEKTATVITDLSPKTYGTILDALSVGQNGMRRAVQRVLLVVNPKDYFTKVFPATTPRTTDGSYAHDVFPYPTSVIQSAAVPVGKAIFGLGDKYFMGIGTQSGGKIEYSDEYKFLEQQRTYLIYLYGYGRAMDENAFLLADISGLTAEIRQVNVKAIESVVKTKEQTV
ncbi:MAG: phage major capsid protein [Evtepia sp.]